MKKGFTLLIIAALLCSLTACGKQSETAEEASIQRDVDLPQCGLSYTIPAAWVETENTNLIPVSYVDPSAVLYAKVQYNYTPDENMAPLNDTESTIAVEDLMTPLVELLVLRTENLEAAEAKEELAFFNSVDSLGEAGDFSFFFLTDYANGIDHFSKEAQKTFRELESYLPELRESIEISVPDEAAVQATAEENSKYLNFISNTLDGDPVTSTIFYDYDMTVVNFWASYCEEDNINELDTLQSFYQDLQKKHPNVNFVQVIIDTPGEKAEKIAAEAYKKADVTFTGIMPDRTMAAWITENLEGLPTTVFVDNTGKPADLKIKGTQDASYYMETTETMLKKITE